MTVRTRFAPEPDRPAAHRRRAHGAFLLAVRAAPRRRVHPAHRGHRPRAFDRGSGAGDPRRHAVAGPDHDEGPFYQTRRMDRYAEVIAQFLREGNAYHCYCTKEELEEMRAAQIARKEKPRYDGRCRDRTAPRAGVDPVVRFRNPIEGSVIVDDVVHGPITFDERRARRPDHRPLGRHADVQLLRRRRRHRHAHHARDPRRRPPQQHAAADQHAARAGRRAAGVRARADDPRARRHEALQASRRGERAAVPRGGFPARGAAQLSRRGSAGRTATRKSSRSRR